MSEPFVHPDVALLVEAFGMKVPSAQDFWDETNTDAEGFIATVQGWMTDHDEMADPIIGLRTIAGFLFRRTQADEFDAARVALIAAAAVQRLAYRTLDRVQLQDS